MTKIIVCGGRDFDDYEVMNSSMYVILLDIKDEIEIVSGTAKGADSLGEKYARENDLRLKQFAPNWEKYGRSAGVKRNADMLQYIMQDATPIVVAFWNGKSKGTANMIKQAEKNGVKVYVISYK